MSEGNVLAHDEMKKVRDFITTQVEYYFYNICGMDYDVKNRTNKFLSIITFTLRMIGYAPFSP